ncbi:hypothetical protein [Allocoleopsis sp.]|uniref:hypothetical protein n=1 Tax=Allocoleopsis sp. TaxID=3088169 RepID=UPI002FD4295F
MEFILLTAARPSLGQPDLNAQLRQALCAQNWGQALQVLDQMKRAAEPRYTSQINLYRSRIQVFARENVQLSKSIGDCSASAPASSAPANPSTPLAPSPDIPPSPSNNPPAAVPSNEIPPVSPIPNLPPPPPL